ncbi:cytochrome ubiquinol oxidase subunit I [Vibrio lentus]|nr:cytochrome ubiquinol oxidase subunit I [Vibrio lentus]
MNFALGVTTGLTMEFQFGTNWSYYSHYVGDIFGALCDRSPCCILPEESTLLDCSSSVGKGCPNANTLSTWLVALGSSFSALWICQATVGCKTRLIGVQLPNHAYGMTVSPNGAQPSCSG